MTASTIYRSTMAPIGMPLKSGLQFGRRVTLRFQFAMLMRARSAGESFAKYFLAHEASGVSL
jgi:hypothetical protein